MVFIPRRTETPGRVIHSGQLPPNDYLVLYNEIYWDLWMEGYRGHLLRLKTARIYRSIYGN